MRANKNNYQQQDERRPAREQVGPGDQPQRGERDGPAAGRPREGEQRRPGRGPARPVTYRGNIGTAGEGGVGRAAAGPGA